MCDSLLTFQILNGHDKGILSLSWCMQDANLLLSCGKDQRTLAWNPDTAEVIGEVRSYDETSVSF